MSRAQAIQIESSARPCAACDGRGTVEDLPRNAKPWDSNDVQCPRCEGSKVEPCDHCGEPSATRYLREDLCAECEPADEYRFDACSLCDRPIDIRESALPLCPRCQQTCEAHGDLDRERRRQERVA